jgi:molybdopterin synthase catalytic subunit
MMTPLEPRRCHVRVQLEDFDLAQEQADLLAGVSEAGAVVSFVGTVRGFSAGQLLHSMSLEHYPGMTESAIEAVAVQALARFAVLRVRVVHRVGCLHPGAQIVGVWVAAQHRGQAFQACEFVMDYLKTRAPFWKKEHRLDGDHWVQPRPEDEQAAARWVLGG